MKAKPLLLWGPVAVLGVLGAVGLICLLCETHSILVAVITGAALPAIGKLLSFVRAKCA